MDDETIRAVARPVLIGASVLCMLVGAVADARGMHGTSARDHPQVVISAVLADGYAPADADEAVQIWNLTDMSADVSGWSISDGEGAVRFPNGVRIPARARRWLTRDGTAFESSFGHPPHWTWSGSGAPGPDAAPRVMIADGRPLLANGGDGVRLIDAEGHVRDAVQWVRDDGLPEDSWRGEPVPLFRRPGMRREGQLIARKVDPDTGIPVPDTDEARDWAADPLDPVLGRRVRYPGWDLHWALQPARGVERATWRLAVAPDGLLPFLVEHIDAAERWIDLLVYTLDSPDVAQALADRARAGVRVRVLLDNTPAGGHSTRQRWCLHLMATAGVEVFLMDRGGDIGRRYRSAHAKLMVVDGRTALIGTENPGVGSAPPGGGPGRRGAWLATDAPGVIHRAAQLAARDLDRRHADVRPYQSRDPRHGAPAPDFRPVRTGLPGDYRARWRRITEVRGSLPWELVSAPESALHASRGPLGMIGRAGAGDTVRVAQMREAPWWGEPEEGTVARNPRLRALIAAARRGAQVRVMLDAHFDDPGHHNSNAAAARWLNEVARVERLPLEVRLANPAGHGLHAKIVLLEHGYPSDDRFHRAASPPVWERVRHWSHVGSLNGSEAASKANREVAVMVGARAIHDGLAEVFDRDWRFAARVRVVLPWLVR